MSTRIRTAVLVLLAIAAAVPPARAQERSPVVGVDVFGTDAFTGAGVRMELGEDLDSIAAAFGSGRFDDAVIARYERVLNTLRARGDFVFLDLAVINYFEPERRTYITIDVVERADSARRMAFRAPPADTVPDPEGVLRDFMAYLDRAMQLLMQGQVVGEQPPCPVLHCAPGFMHDSLRAVTDRFVRSGSQHLGFAADVLRRDADPKRRAAAAFLLGYGADAQAVADVLAAALTDPAAEVRNNALRVLIMLAQREPPVDIPVAPVIAALHFPATSDRNKAGYVLLGLAARPENRATILRDAGAVLLDMLELQQPNNRDAAHEVLKRLSGESWPAEDVARWRDWWQRALEE